MADVRPLRALHYDPARVALEAVTAPPYDVIDPDGRRELLARSPHNVVALDLPEAPGGGDRYEHAAELLRAWRGEGVLVADDEPTIWAYEQEYQAPGGERRTRRGFLARIAVTDYGPGLIRPHERTQPGPKEDRLRLTRATAHNLSPIFVLHSGDAWSAIGPALGGEPFCAVSDPDGTVHRTWPIADAEVHAAVAAAVADSELLIADGHHRYETARTYADEVGAGAGDDARYTLACLVSLDDPGLSVFATHRLLHGLDEGGQRELREALMAGFDVTAVDDPSDLVPGPGDGTVAFGYLDAAHDTPFRLRLRDESALAAALPDASEAYRTLDAAALETLVLRGPLGMSSDDIAAKRGLSYCSDLDEAIARVERGDADAGFFLRPTPVGQVRAVADAGETMPPKSTYFFPKLLTGLVFNPLAPEPRP